MKLLDQQVVIHAFAAADGDGAEAAVKAMDEIWRGCGHVFRMTESIPGANAPRMRAGGLASLPLGRETVLAAQESSDASFQSVLRMHHDVLNLSIALAMPEQPPGSVLCGADEHWTWWRELDDRWHRLAEYAAPHLLGEARLYLARVDDEAGITAPAPDLYHRLAGLLPAQAAGSRAAESAGLSMPAGFALWETATEPDERALRRFVLAIRPDADHAASAWAWSRGDTQIPPCARYLLNAAKIRYELRVWQRDGRARRLRNSLDTLDAELRRLGAGDAARQELLMIRRDTLLQRADLSQLRHTVDIAAANLGRAFDLTGLLTPGGPFADDAGLAKSMLERLDDEIAYLGQTAERAELSGAAVPHVAAPQDDGAVPAGQPAGRLFKRAVSATPPGPAFVTAAKDAQGEDQRRNVFVVYGRDGQAERVIFDFLRAIGLFPQEWEQVVAQTGKTAPFLAEAVLGGLSEAHAVVVLLTPDDVVYLHPELLSAADGDAESRQSMQARPNVLLELGMALMSHPNKTLVLIAGEQRPVTDLGGINFVKIADTIDCRHKIATRLQAAGCRVDLRGNHWHTAGDFAGLAALRRRPPSGSS